MDLPAKQDLGPPNNDREGIVPRLPTAVLSTGLMVLAFLCIASGLVLDTVTRGRRETKLLAYLGQETPRYTPR